MALAISWPVCVCACTSVYMCVRQCIGRVSVFVCMVEGEGRDWSEMCVYDAVVCTIQHTHTPWTQYAP
ncbi:hypothetical protein B484DRAFT_454181 [Ochromonadaceae sp. CCMP2298]|nr:hypothetical protein B484DRAFT_454378 [Ochromonadaceae sp. CCMP2298]KAJ1416782.1 hypothetical protein B484DRAFT_454181 [Ochromonadaceae sp. CCMP2298]